MVECCPMRPIKLTIPFNFFTNFLYVFTVSCKYTNTIIVMLCDEKQSCPGPVPMEPNLAKNVPLEVN